MKRNVELSEENLRIAQLQFKVGIITSHEVNRYKITHSEARNRYIDTLIDYQIAKARFDRAMGE